jgi:hypothetical protein
VRGDKEKGDKASGDKVKNDNEILKNKSFYLMDF